MMFGSLVETVWTAQYCNICRAWGRDDPIRRHPRLHMTDGGECDPQLIIFLHSPGLRVGNANGHEYKYTAGKLIEGK